MQDNKIINSLSIKEGIWIEIETNKGEDHYHEGVKLTCSYRGLLSKTDFQRILDHSADSSFVKLERVYWIDSCRHIGKHLHASATRFGYDQLYRNFNGPLFLRINQIVAMAPLNGDKDMKWIQSSATAKRTTKLPVGNT